MINIKLLLSILLFVGAAVFFYLGYSTAQDFSGAAHESFAGRLAEPTMWYFAIGVGAALGGLALLAFRMRSRPAKRLEFRAGVLP